MLIENRLTIAAAKDPRGASADVMLEAAAELARLRATSSFYSRWFGYLAFEDTDRPPCAMQSPAASDGSGRGQRRDVARPETKGKVAGGPAHHTLLDRLHLTSADREAVEWYAAWVHEVVPLYRSPTLTDAEREAVAYYIGTGGPQAVDDALRGLLERLGGER